MKLALVNDVTERRKAENELRRSEELFRGIFESTSAGVSLTDAGGRFVSCNPAFAAMLGRSVEEVLRLTPAGLSHPDDLAGLLALMDEVRAGRRDRFNYSETLPPPRRPNGVGGTLLRGDPRRGRRIRIRTRCVGERHRTGACWKTICASAEDGGTRPDGGRRRARFQQHLLTAVIGNLLAGAVAGRRREQAAPGRGGTGRDPCRRSHAQLLGYARRNQLVFAPVEPRDARAKLFRCCVARSTRASSWKCT